MSADQQFMYMARFLIYYVNTLQSNHGESTSIESVTAVIIVIIIMNMYTVTWNMIT